MRARSRLEAEIGTLRAELEQVRGQLALRAPLLWNDMQRAPGPPLGTVAELAGPDPAAALAAACDVHPEGPQRELLRAQPIDALVRYALDDPIPIPAAPDREHYFARTGDLTYWASGLGDALFIADVARARSRPLASGMHCLDFGCSSGRVLRHLPHVAPGVRTSGIDIQTHAVAWARTHLPASMPIALGSTLPALPFASDSIDVVYAGSVFTHIADFEEAWLLELARVLRPGGVAILTFHPDRLWAALCDAGAESPHPVREIVLRTPHRMDAPGVTLVTPETLTGPLPGARVVFTALDYPVNNTNLVHTHAWIRERWGRWFEVERIVEHAHGVWQDAAVLTPRREGR